MLKVKNLKMVNLSLKVFVQLKIKISLAMTPMISKQVPKHTPNFQISIPKTRNSKETNEQS